MPAGPGTGRTSTLRRGGRVLVADAASSQCGWSRLDSLRGVEVAAARSATERATRQRADRRAPGRPVVLNQLAARGRPGGRRTDRSRSCSPELEELRRGRSTGGALMTDELRARSTATTTEECGASSSRKKTRCRCGWSRRASSAPTTPSSRRWSSSTSTSSGEGRGRRVDVHALARVADDGAHRRGLAGRRGRARSRGGVLVIDPTKKWERRCSVLPWSTDLLIVGAGPTGLFAAYYAGFRGMSVAVVDSLPELGGQVSAMYPEKAILDVAGFPTVKGRELVERAGRAGREREADVPPRPHRHHARAATTTASPSELDDGTDGARQGRDHHRRHRQVQPAAAAGR